MRPCSPDSPPTPGSVRLTVARGTTEHLQLEITEQEAVALRGVLWSIDGPEGCIVRQVATGLDGALAHINVPEPMAESIVTGTLHPTGFAPSTLNPNP